MTLGERRIRTNFNPSGKSFIDEIKDKSAELIDLINGSAPKPELDDEDFKEFKRLQALAMTHYETAAMFAVKCLTV